MIAKIIFISDITKFYINSDMIFTKLQEEVFLPICASWCGPCVREANPAFSPLFEKYNDYDKFCIIGIMTSDSTEKHLEAFQSINYPWQPLIDSELLFCKTYGFQFFPFIMLIAPDGKNHRRNLSSEEIWKYVDKALSE